MPVSAVASSLKRLAGIAVLLAFALGSTADPVQAQDPVRVPLDSLRLLPPAVVSQGGTQAVPVPESTTDTARAAMVVTTIGPGMTRTDTVMQSLELPDNHVALIETPDAPLQTQVKLSASILETLRSEGASPAETSLDQTTVNVVPLQVIESGPLGRLTRRTLVWRAVQGGFMPSGTSERFTATVLAWLHDGSVSGATPLAQPVSIVVSAERAVGLEPETVRLERANDPTRIRIEATPPGDSTWVSFDRVGASTRSTARRHYLPVLRHEIASFAATNDDIPGLGLGTTTLNLTMPRTITDSLSVSLNAESASIAPRSVRLGPGETATFTVRSWNVGPETIRVVGRSFTQANRTVDLVFFFPWLFLGATVLGGLAGGGFRFVQIRSKKDLALSEIWPYLATGLLAALLGTVASAIGINIFSIDAGGTTGPAVIFIIAAACGAAGPSLPFLKSIIGS